MMIIIHTTHTHTHTAKSKETNIKVGMWKTSGMVCVIVGGFFLVVGLLFWRRVQRGHHVVIQLLCRQDTPSLGSVVLLQHPSRHYITQLKRAPSTPLTPAHTHTPCVQRRLQTYYICIILSNIWIKYKYYTCTKTTNTCTHTLHQWTHPQTLSLFLHNHQHFT